MCGFPIPLLAFFGTIDATIAASTSHELFCGQEATEAEMPTDCQERERWDGGTVFQALFTVETI
jgi:hypothetical protein